MDYTPPPSRNQISYISSVVYLASDDSRFNAGKTKLATNTEYNYTGTDPDGSYSNHTIDIDQEVESGASDGLLTYGTTYNSDAEGVTYTQRTGSTATNAGYSSGDTEHSGSQTRDYGRFQSTRTFSSTNNTFSNSNSNNNFSSSRAGVFAFSQTSIGATDDSYSYSYSRKNRSDGGTIESKAESRSPIEKVSGGLTASNAAGTTIYGDETRTNSGYTLNQTFVVFQDAAKTTEETRDTLIEYSSDEDGRSVFSTFSTNRIIRGGAGISRTQTGATNDQQGLTLITYDDDGNAGQFVTGSTSTDGTSTSYETTAIESTQTGSSTRSGNLGSIGSSRSYFTSTDSIVLEVNSTASTSTEISRVYNLPSSYTDTMRSYILESTEISQTKEGVSSSSVELTEDIVTSPYNYRYYEVSTRVYEGGWGVYGFTDITSVENSLDFTTFGTDQVSTSVEINTNRRIVTYSQENAIASSDTDTTNTTTDAEDFTFTIPATTTEGDLEYINNSSVTTTVIEIGSGSPTNTYYRNHNFGGSPATSYDTVEGSSVIYLGTTSADTDRKSTLTTERVISIQSSPYANTYTIVGTFHNMDIVITDTYFDGTNVEELTTNRMRGYTTFTSYKNNFFGVVGGSMSKTFTSIDIGRNIISSAVPAGTFITFSSAKLGMRYISQSNTNISDRNNCFPPEIKYTENILTTTIQTYEGAEAEATLHTITTRDDQSYDIPVAQRYSINGFNYLIRDEELTVYDNLKNSITYDDTSGRKESRATFAGSFTTVSTLSDGETATAKQTYVGHKVFNTFFDNVDGAVTMQDFTTYDEGRFFGGNGFYDTYEFYFGGCQHYGSNGTLSYAQSLKFTLVDRNDSGITTEISGDLSDSGFTTTELDLGGVYFISTANEAIAGSENRYGSQLVTKTYARQKDIYY